MNWTKISRLVLRSILMIVVVCATFIQWMKFTEENTNISISYVERDVELPSMTFCPFKDSHIQQGNITFATYMKEGILKASEFFSMANQQIYMPGKMEDINVNLLKNDTYWKNSYYVQQLPHTRLTSCLTLDLPDKILSKPKRSWIGMDIKLSKGSIFYKEFHGKGQSRMNQGWTYHDLFELKVWKLEIYYVESSIRRKIKTKNYNCYEKNDMHQADCLNDFYMKKLNCTFPWIKSSQKSLEKCGDRHYINDLIDLVDGVAKGENLSNEVQKCLIPNCATTSWKIVRQDSYPAVFKTSVQDRYDSGRKVEVTDEFLDYTGLDLLNAFGGYLGLFIGASLLAFYDTIVNTFLQLISKVKNQK